MDNCCKICGSGASLQEHHLSYSPASIITVCTICHKSIHKNKHGVGRSNQISIINGVVTIKGKISRKESNIGSFGFLISKGLAQFIGKEVNIRVEEINSVQVN